MPSWPYNAEERTFRVLRSTDSSASFGRGGLGASSGHKFLAPNQARRLLLSPAHPKATGRCGDCVQTHASNSGSRTTTSERLFHPLFDNKSRTRCSITVAESSSPHPSLSKRTNACWYCFVKGAKKSCDAARHPESLQGCVYVLKANFRQFSDSGRFRMAVTPAFMLLSANNTTKSRMASPWLSRGPPLQIMCPDRFGLSTLLMQGGDPHARCRSRHLAYAQSKAPASARMH